MFITPCAPDGPARDAGRVLVEGAAKAAVVLN
jgi:hypothetical protein